MVEIRIYVEGGGDGKESKAAFREGMSKFLKRLTGQQQQIKITCVVCGRRNAAHRNFTHDLTNYPDAINLLLVDSEGPVNTLTIDPNADPEEKDRVMGLIARQHLINRDGWDLSGIDENDIHLMVQVMESWLIADIDTLAKHYGQKFNRKAIPRNDNVEEISTADIESALNRATQITQKGRYHKIKHGPKILEKIDVSIVRKKAPYCDRLFRRITNIGG
ncbi:conserved hypothetical protein [Planktothrix serta PCC 8927]|uniref:DUF4276 family protein n=1 Tax=Planktothrix serta PCC 8927 TaxID=671068 RepID=A0A7Z9DVN1_9CYAN|nr:DUF4276 family protein [Planktothrix serta]VXD13785.1 conserved hypothetical protein [Planktothrix serta PCC 8927]